jgi:hypothetical protein
MQENPYIIPGEEFKSIAYLVKELWCCKRVANCESAAVSAAEVCTSRTVVV